LRALPATGPRDDRPDARDGGEQALLLAPRGRAADIAVDLGIHLGEFALQGIEQAGDGPPQAVGRMRPTGEALLALPLGDDHGDDLAAAGDEVGEALCGLVGQGPRLGPGGGHEAGDQAGVDRVGLGAPAERLAEGADGGRVDDDHRQSGGAEGGGGDDGLEAAGGLEGDGLGAERLGRASSWSSPAASQGTTKRSPAGRTATSRRSLETSMPTKVASMATPLRVQGGALNPCASGLRERWPKRLFGFDGTAEGGPGSDAGSAAPGAIGLPSATAPGSLSQAGSVATDLQGAFMRQHERKSVRDPAASRREHTKKAPGIAPRGLPSAPALRRAARLYSLLCRTPMNCSSSMNRLMKFR
jgi:hypothetical protein